MLKTDTVSSSSLEVMSSYPRVLSTALTAAAFVLGLAMYRNCNTLIVSSPLRSKHGNNITNPGTGSSNFILNQKHIYGNIDNETDSAVRFATNDSKLDDEHSKAPGRNEGIKAPKRATAVLIRTGANESAYAGLLRRNVAIAQRAWAASADHLIFHDGSLSLAHAEYIRAHSTGLRHHVEAANSTNLSSLQFVSAQPTFDRARRAIRKASSNRYCKPTLISKRYFLGYKAMCWFWFKDVLSYPEVLKYDELLRIDDDCYLSDLKDTTDKSSDFWPSTSADVARTAGFTPAIMSGDEASGNAQMDPIAPLASVAEAGTDNKAATMGMRQAFAELNGSTFAPTWQTPYTNVLLYNVSYLSHSAELAQVYRKVVATGCVWVNRWGDAPLWGATSALLGWPALPLGGIGGYEHGSHGMVHVTSGLIDYAHRPTQRTVVF